MGNMLLPVADQMIPSVAARHGAHAPPGKEYACSTQCMLGLLNGAAQGAGSGAWAWAAGFQQAMG